MTSLAYTNPVFAGYFADPFVWSVGEDHYAIGTGEHEAAGSVAAAGTASVFPLLCSTDLVTWRRAGQALVRPDPALGDTFWAPEIAHHGGQWFLYYSVGHEDREHQLRVAVAEHPLGPYTDRAGLTDVRACPFAIDPHPFRDHDGRWWLFHARDFLDLVDDGRPVRAGTALVVHELTSMTSLAPDGHTVARARADWQRFAADRPMYGRVLDWHTLEGPFVVPHDGRYYCLYSGGCWQTDTYGVDYVVADSVRGPWSDAGVERGPRVLRSVPGRVIGPGHCSVVRGPHGGRLLAYHAWDPELRARRLCLDPLVFTEGGPRSPGPTWTPQRMDT